MNTFYTITDEDTKTTNSRSQRFYSEESAIQAAIVRVHSSQCTKGVIVMKAIKIVKPETPPISVEDLTELKETRPTEPPSNTEDED